MGGRGFTALLLFLVALSSGCAAGVTGSPLNVSTDGATVAGRVASNTGGAGEYWVQYGRTQAYGSETPHRSITLVVNRAATVFVSIAGLERGTVYHYRLCAKDSDGGSCGTDAKLTTQSVACGETVAQSVRLTGTLDCAGQGAALVVGADGIDINLAGYGIEGAGLVNTGFDDVTVRNGAVGGTFSSGITLTDASRNRIVRVTVSLGSAAYAVSVEGGQGNVLRGGFARARGSGVAISGSPGTVIADYDLAGQTQAGAVVSGGGVTITRSKLLAFSTGGEAVTLTGSGNRLIDSIVAPGSPTGPFTGVTVSAGTGNRIAGNDVSGFDALSTGPANGDGIFVAADASGTVVTGDRALDNGGDGLDIRDTTARVGNNIANDNGQLGIAAVAGVTDRGGNRASGNGNPLQCTNVFCL